MLIMLEEFTRRHKINFFMVQAVGFEPIKLLLKTFIRLFGWCF